MDFRNLKKSDIQEIIDYMEVEIDVDMSDFHMDEEVIVDDYSIDMSKKRITIDLSSKTTIYETVSYDFDEIEDIVDI